MKNAQGFAPVQEFIKIVGSKIARYFGKDPACIIYLQPDGVYYAEGLYEWLRKKKKNVVITTMEDDGTGLDDAKVRGRKVLLVDNDVVTGKGYKRSMEALRTRKRSLKIKDIKFATYFDRVGVTDFAVSKYSPEALWYLDEMDALDLKIISYLTDNGRASLAEIGKKTNLSSVAVRNRINRLLTEKILKVYGLLFVDQFYTMSAQIQIEADSATVEKFLENFEAMQEVYHLTRTSSGRYNLIVGIYARNLENVDEFIENEVRKEKGVKKIDVFFGELPVRPKYFMLRL